MSQPTTFLRCSQTTATFAFIIIGLFFSFTGCAQLYKFIGLTEEQTQEQISQDQKTLIRTITLTRTTAGDIITTIIAGLGTIAAGILAKWLGTERKITAAMIKGIEENPTGNVKESIEAKATAAGVERILHTRIKYLT